MLLGANSTWAEEKTENVNFNNGVFDTDHTTWTVGAGITIQQLRGTSTNPVNSDYIKNPRIYKEHILSFTAATDYAIKSISITYGNKDYSGNTMTAGTEMSENKVTGNTTDISCTWAKDANGTHVISSVSTDGLSQIYIQTGSQLRPTAISITYIAPEGVEVKETATLSISSETIFSGNTATITTNGPTITLSTKDTSIATVSGTTITGIAAGSVEITATWPEGTVGGKTYAAGSQVFNVTVEENNSVTIDDQGNITFDFTKNYWSLPTDYVLDEESYTSSGYTITLKGTGDNGYKYGSSTGGAFLLFGREGAYLTLPAFSFDVSKIVVTGNEGASGKTTQNIFVGETAVSTETTGVKGTNTYEIASGYQEAGKVYTIKVTNANNSQITQIVVYKKTDDFVSTPTVSPEAGGYPSAQRVVLSCATADATIHYTLDGTEPDANSATYSTPISITTTTTIKAIAIKGTVTSSVLSATFTIVPLEHAGTEADPYTVADARNAIDASIGITEVYATGIVSEIVTAYSEQHGNITFNISEDGLTLQAYRCKGATGVDVSGVKPGDVVLIKGNLKKYNDTYEFDSGCELISLQHPVTPVITATPASLTEFTYVVNNGPSEAQTISVSGENLTADITLALGESSNYEMSLTEGADYTNTLTLSQSEGSVEATTVYVRLKANLEEGSYNDGTITITSEGATEKTISLAGSVTEPEAPNMAWDLSKDETITATETEMIWTSSYASMAVAKGSSSTNSNNYYPGTTGKTYTSTRFYTGSNLTIIPASGYSITKVVFVATSTSYASALKGSTWTNATAEVNATTVTVTPTDGAAAILATIGATCGFTSVKVYYEEATTVKVTIPESKYATFACAFATDFSSARILAYTAKVEENSVKLYPIEGNIVPANTGVVLYAETAGEFTGTVTSGGSVSNNELVAAVTDTKVEYSANTKFNYILQGSVFKKATGAILKSGKAYLSTDYDVTPTGSRELKIVVDGETTGIKAIETAADKNVYDLQGRKVAAPTKGLYIINGKKMIVK